jgi:1-propanol dehydrogenase
MINNRGGLIPNYVIQIFTNCLCFPKNSSYYRHKAVNDLTEFTCPTRVISGCNALSYLETLSAERVLLVTDSYFSENGTAAQIASRIPNAQTQIFDRVAPDPDLALVAQGVAVMQSFAPDCLIALGGGSPMDCAKAMKYLSDSDATLIAIPTTSGTGSEVTSFSIITKDGVKLPLIDDSLAPQVALLDPSLLENLPRSLIADAGFDAIAHCLEAAAATGSSAMSQALAQQAFAIANDALLPSYRGDRSVRMKMHEAACMAGIAFNNAGLGACHALSHALGGQFHIAHGRLNAVLLPSVMTRNAAVALSQYAALAKAAGIEGSTERLRFRALQQRLAQLRRALGLPETLKEAGVEPASLHRQMGEICKAALADRCMETNPVPMEETTLREILTEAAE